MKYIFTTILCLAFHTLTLFSQPIIPCGINHSNQRDGYVAACMIFQNEARFLKEWLEYHKSIGISHFYLYNHASSDHFWPVLIPYVKRGEVELFDLYEKTSNVREFIELQRQVYNHAVHLAKGRHEWLAIIDSDEFICMPHHKNLGLFLESYMYAAGLVVNWVMYGSSGVEELSPSELLIEHLVYRAPDNWNENFLYKSIVRPAYVVKADVHTCQYRPDISVYANHQRFSHTPNFKKPPIDEIRINHYWWRDEKYFREVKLPRRAGWLSGLNERDIEIRREIYNSIYDPSITHLVEETHRNMQK